MSKSVLILGGTADARRLADHLVETHGDRLRVITSLAGRTTSPRRPKGELREGGFGGARGLGDYLRNTEIDMVVDATHPFAAQISAHAASACDATDIPRVSLIRPPWTPKPSDKWIPVADIAAAADELSHRDGPCLITTGINDLAAFQDVTGPKLIVRLIEAPRDDVPIKDAEIVIGTPPYRLDDERVLFRMLGITTLVTKNAGGDATRAKIDAAADLGLDVIMIDRPPLAHGAIVVDDRGAADAVAETLAL